MAVDDTTGELYNCSKKKLLVILEDMQMEYTPYYTHYYHLLNALPTEYRNKTILQQKLREKICAKLEQKTILIQESIVEKYLIEGGVNQLASWINFYCKKCFISVYFDEDNKQGVEKIDGDEHELEFLDTSIT